MSSSVRHTDAFSPGLDRRELLSSTGRLLAGCLGAGLFSNAGVRDLCAQRGTAFADPWYLVDTDGNGIVDAADVELVRRALRTRRGMDLVPLPGYDPRADVLARGFVDHDDLRAVQRLVGVDMNVAAPARPVTLAWHYSWHNSPMRKPRTQTAWYKGGAYSSRSPEIEAQFNDLKNEFGVSVDVLAWADPRVNRKLQPNIEEGYLGAGNGRTRHAALLYETYLSMGVAPGLRIDFEDVARRLRLVEQVRLMARLFVKIRDESPVRVFRIDGKPVVFLFGSHAWGLNHDGAGPQYDWIDATIENAREVFRRTFGVEPYLVGEEMPFVLGDKFKGGRARRSRNFDAIYSYHHAADPRLVVDGGQRLRGRYTETLKSILDISYFNAPQTSSRFTEKPLFVIPSFAAGFAKHGLPFLRADIAEYDHFLTDMLDHHHARYMQAWYSDLLGHTPPMVVSLGSWNEEFEGHAVFPAEFNRAMSPRMREGFDWALAIKKNVGWNRYAGRKLDLRFEPGVTTD